MKTRCTIVFILLLLCMAGCTQATVQPTADSAEQTAINEAIYTRIATALHDDTQLPMPDLVVKVALELLGTPYVGGTLETEPEALHIYMDKTDCILFVEMSVCMALTLKGKCIRQAGDGVHFCNRVEPSLSNATPSYALLAHNIRNMRYRLGVVDGYASRIHYTSEWLLQNATNGILYEYTRELGEEHAQFFSYMSSHPDNYIQLSKDSVQLARVKQVEEHLTTQQPYYTISQEALRTARVMGQIKSGDIITFISPREGLDLSHVAIAYEVDGQMHFIHASYAAKKVIVEPQTLADYAVNGLRISRLKSL